MGHCRELRARKPPKPARSANNDVSKTTKAAKVAKVVKAKAGKGCKSAQAQGQPKIIPPRREYARQTFPLSNVRGCPQTDAAIMAPAPAPVLQQHPPCPGAPPESKRDSIASKIKRLRPVSDHLLQLPKPCHKYLSVQGRILFDNRYAVPPPTVKPPPSKPSTPSTPSSGLASPSTSTSTSTSPSRKRKATQEPEERTPKSQRKITVPARYRE